MLTDARFWIGVAVGAIGYHFVQMRRAKAAA